MKYKQPCPGNEFGSPCPFPMMITITPLILPAMHRIILTCNQVQNIVAIRSTIQKKALSMYNRKAKCFYIRTIYTYKVKLVTVVEGSPKASFSIATTPKCWEGRYSIP